MSKRTGISGLLLLLLLGCQSTGTMQESRQLAEKRFGQQKARLKYVLAQEQLDRGQLPESQKLIQEAIGLDPDEPSYVLLMTKICLEQGDFVKADAVVRSIPETNPPLPEQVYLIGLIAERNNQMEQALQSYFRASQLDSHKIEYVLACGEILVTLDRNEEALSFVDSRLADFNGHGRLQALRGEILILLGRDREAASAFGAAAAQFPNDTNLLESQAMALYWAGDYAEAVAALRALRSQIHDTMPPHTSRALAHAYMEIGEYITAQTYLEEITSRDPEDISAWMLLGQCHLAQDHLDAAGETVRRLVELAPDKPGTLALQGYVLLRKQQPADARRALEAALRNDPRDGLAWCLLGQAAESMNQPQRARECYERALALRDDDPLALRLLQQVQQTQSPTLHPAALNGSSD